MPTNQHKTNAADAKRSSKSTPGLPMAVLIKPNSKNTAEYIGLLQDDPHRGKVAFFENDKATLDLRPNEFAFVDGEVAPRFRARKFAFITLFGGRSYGSNLDDALAQVTREMETTPVVDEETRAELEMADENQRVNRWNRFLEVATAPSSPDDHTIVKLIAEVGEGRNPDGIEIGGILTPPLGVTEEIANGSAYFYGPKFQAIIGVNDLMTADPAWTVQGFILSEDKLEVAMTKVAPVQSQTKPAVGEETDGGVAED